MAACLYTGLDSAAHCAQLWPTTTLALTRTVNVPAMLRQERGGEGTRGGDEGEVRRVTAAEGVLCAAAAVPSGQAAARAAERGDAAAWRGARAAAPPLPNSQVPPSHLLPPSSPCPRRPLSTGRQAGRQAVQRGCARARLTSPLLQRLQRFVRIQPAPARSLATQCSHSIHSRHQMLLDLGGRQAPAWHREGPRRRGGGARTEC